ncbi:hypothetical protein, partial [Marinobacter sp. SS21]|uniref:hypothetical protein n=1 Tax=Marinobacter sp. SS21 TaxID=2979460 RepID=UPI00232FBF7B
FCLTNRKLLASERVTVKNSVAECKTVDEQKQIILLATPVMTQERFAQLTGLTEGQVRGMIEKGHLPSIKIGKPRLVNVALVSQTALESEDWG